ncbi:hypothetical protein PENANT_c017G04208 [Penicillium antarcticum]|uniref:Uncharacterized protein n=1 Tax=Penicillium antarcticum TaxID=416450 RepID=A0A1V6Q1S7_9EURO|nr:hypothetical protein PENANT_c017G04208 [Penicillium antarcticum]
MSSSKRAINADYWSAAFWRDLSQWLPGNFIIGGFTDQVCGLNPTRLINLMHVAWRDDRSLSGRGLPLSALSQNTSVSPG